MKVVGVKLVGSLGAKVHDDRHWHTLGRRLAHRDLGENLGLQSLVQSRIAGGFGKGDFGNMTGLVQPDANLHIHHSTAGFLVFSKCIENTTLHLPGIVAKLAAVTASASAKSPTHATASRGKTRGIITLDAGG